jgi:hypothetical protein
MAELPTFDLTAILTKAGCTQALIDVARERVRQVKEEGWTPAHDDEHTNGALAKAGASYALCAGIGLSHAAGQEHHYEFAAEYSKAECPEPPWPFDLECWKPKDPRRDLVRSAALILAEIERIDRAAARG